jgi:alkaline phosphatase D
MPTRRQVLGAAAATVLAPHAVALGNGRRAPLLRGGRFRQGVMSGDPTPRSIVLWTRVDDVERAGAVRLEVATDRGFRDVVATELVRTSAARDHTVKARVAGLKPRERYWYRFETATATSPVGRFRTAPPADSHEPVRFAFFSCQEWTHGWWNAHALMADEDLDFVVCLGDYVYERPLDLDGPTGPYTAVRPDPVGDARTLDGYRAKYRLYRSDAALREVHRRFPLVAIWDDHEVEDNYAGGDPGSEDWDPARRRAGYRAWFEAMPAFAASAGTDRVYRRLRYGRSVDLFMLDERQYRANQPCNDLPGPPCPERERPRAFLGRRQMRWLKDGLRASTASWKVVGNELPIMPAKVGNAYVPGFDTWQGYPVERRELLSHLRDRRIRDVAFVAGDVHFFAAGDVRVDDGDARSVVAHEFVGGSISSASPGESTVELGGVALRGNDRNPRTPPGLIRLFEGSNPWVDALDVDHHGYGVVEASRRELDVRLRRVATVKERSRRRLRDLRWTVERGTRGIGGQESSPAD